MREYYDTHNEYVVLLSMHMISMQRIFSTNTVRGPLPEAFCELQPQVYLDAGGHSWLAKYKLTGSHWRLHPRSLA
jgi:hypothetical protein